MGRLHLESPYGLEHVQTAYVGKDNPIEVILKDDAADYDYSTATVVRAKIGSVILDSAADEDAFDRTEASLGKLKIFIGNETIPAQAHNVKVEIVIDDKTLFFEHVRVNVKNPGM